MSAVLRIGQATAYWASNYVLCFLLYFCLHIASKQESALRRDKATATLEEKCGELKVGGNGKKYAVAVMAQGIVHK